MSTDYTFEPELTEDVLIERLPETLQIHEPSHKRWIDGDGAFRHRFCVGYSGSWLWVSAAEGAIVRFERYGSNAVKPILEALAEEFGLRVADQYGAVLGEDDWFSG